MSTPFRDRPEMPDGYGIEQAVEFMEWGDVESRLRESRNYWLATTRPDGRPHVVPRWGVWLDGVFWYDGDPKTLHARNLESNAGCVLHLEDGMAVTIVEGRSVSSDSIDAELGSRLAGEYARKYAPTYAPEPDAWSDDIAGGMRKVIPAKVLAWSEFPKDMTRFTF